MVIIELSQEGREGPPTYTPLLEEFYSTYREQDIYIDWTRMYARPYEGAFRTAILDPTWYWDSTAIVNAIDDKLGEPGPEPEPEPDNGDEGNDNGDEGNDNGDEEEKTFIEELTEAWNTLEPWQKALVAGSAIIGAAFIAKPYIKR